MELIRQYFSSLSEKQMQQLESLDALYREWNSKINVISRKDIDALYLHHVLHSMVLVKYNPFADGMQVLDAGTGGGFPGIPLAICYPDVQFTLLDSTAKKIHVVNEVATTLGLRNVTGVHARIEEYSGQFDIITSRAVSSLTQMIAWSRHLAAKKRWVILKGGDPKELRKELPPLYKMEFTPVNHFFQNEYFQDKYTIDIRG